MGDGPSQNLRWGTAHVSVPTIYREVVLLDACESTNWVKRNEGTFCSEMEAFLVKKGGFLISKGPYIYQISDSKKGHQKFLASKWDFFPKNRSFWNFVPRIFFPSLQTRRQVSAYWSSGIAWIIFLLAIHCFVVGLLYVMLLYGHLYSASHRRLFIGALSVTGRWKEGSSNYVETQVISPVASNSGVQKECHFQSVGPIAAKARFWDREIRDQGTRGSQRSAGRGVREERAKNIIIPYNVQNTFQSGDFSEI